jgi:hypothetical protein
MDGESGMSRDDFRQFLTAPEPPADGIPDFLELLIFPRSRLLRQSTITPVTHEEGRYGT